MTDSRWRNGARALAARARGLAHRAPPLLGKLRTRRHEAQMAFILLVMIVLPSGVLGYFSWRAIESEKLVSHARLQDSYGQLSRLAGRAIDAQLKKVESGWIAALDSLLARDPAQLEPRRLGALAARDPLIAGCFLLTAPGRVAYPPAFSLRAEQTFPGTRATAALAREQELFERLVAHGEELEYRDRDLRGAIAAYRLILAQVSSPELRGTAESYVGRAQMKDTDWAGALATFRDVLARYPEVRDLNKMYLRFLAQYQVAVALEGMGRDAEALEALVRLNQDLLTRSDEITTLQYSYYSDLIQALAPRLMDAPGLPDRERARQALQRMHEQTKKRLGQKYLVRLLDSELTSMIVRRKHYSPKLRYISDRAEGDPFLLAYRPIADPSGTQVRGLLGCQIDLDVLRDRLFPSILGDLDAGDQVSLSILGQEGGYVIGPEGSAPAPIALQTLSEPFDFWRVGIALRDVNTVMRRIDVNASLWLWLVSILLLSILFGAYASVRRAQRQAYLSRAQSTFVSNVSHELRTPVTSIKMLAELMEMRLEDRPGARGGFGEDAVQYLNIIRHESNRLGRLVDDVLDFSRMERGARSYRFQPADVAEILRITIESFRPNAESSGFSLDVDLGAPLPPLMVDGDALSQVMLNLLSNAVKYSDDDKRIRIQAYRDGPRVAIDVTDRGIGIEAKEIPKVFEKFYRGDARLDSPRQGGLGLGLTLARTIVRAHGGDIRVRSEPGKGSTFTVLLPVPPPGRETGTVPAAARATPARAES